jgi:hypothetical protein
MIVAGMLGQGSNLAQTSSLRSPAEHRKPSPAELVAAVPATAGRSKRGHLLHLSVPVRIRERSNWTVAEDAAANDETYFPNGEAKSVGYTRWICGQTRSAGANESNTSPGQRQKTFGYAADYPTICCTKLADATETFAPLLEALAMQAMSVPTDDAAQLARAKLAGAFWRASSWAWRRHLPESTQGVWATKCSCRRRAFSRRAGTATSRCPTIWPTPSAPIVCSPKP